MRAALKPPPYGRAARSLILSDAVSFSFEERPTTRDVQTSRSSATLISSQQGHSQIAGDSEPDSEDETAEMIQTPPPAYLPTVQSVDDSDDEGEYDSALHDHDTQLAQADHILWISGRVDDIDAEDYRWLVLRFHSEISS